MSDSNIDILAYEASRLGPLCLRRRELLSEPGTIVTEVTLNHEFLMSSLHTKLLTLPGNTIVYPGHGPETTIAEERRGNPFLRG